MALTITPARVRGLRVAKTRRVPIPAAAVAVLALVAAVAFCALPISASVDALKSAGLTGGTPIQGVGEFIESIKGYLVWFCVTVAGTAILVLGAMYLAGHSRAQDYAMRFAIGCLIVAGGTGFIA